MKILSLMVGPYGQGNSVQFEVTEMEPGERSLASGHVDRIGNPDAALTYRRPDGVRKRTLLEVPTVEAAIKNVLAFITDSEVGVLHRPEDLAAVGHRVAHGGERFLDPCYITDRVIEDIRACIPLAPLHNPHNLMGIEAAMRLLPQRPHVVVFSTSFHQSMPDYAFTYGIPYDYYLKYGIRRYGFQGISHKWVTERAAIMLDKPLADTRLISCHLGNGASVAAVKGGRSIDTSMGFTPLEGLVMSTRAGDLDSAILPFLMEREGFFQREVDGLINKRSGLLGISGISANMKDLLKEMEEGSYRARLAVDVFAYRLKKYIASYFGVLGGADAVIFTAGIGENAPIIRKKALDGLQCLGIELDDEHNQKSRQEMVISTPESMVKVLVIPTDEEMMMAREVVKVLQRTVMVDESI